uniref:DNA-directed DNA polymerase n=1 Tax=Caulobacter sp. (strain K31) TaxID=366602 RepID=B0T9E7_CAUSK
MVGRIGRRRAIAHMNLAAAQAGLRVGQAVAHATALIPGLLLHDLDATGDQAGLHRLALWAQKLYSPIVAPDGADGLVIDASGCAHLFGGEEKMAIAIRERLTKAGFSATLAIADSWGGAHALARFSGRAIFVVDPGATGRELRSLPVAALRLGSDLVEGLGRLGFDTIGELEATPKGPLAHRLGLEPVRRLDQALARQAEPIEPVMAAQTLSVRRAFAEPIGAPETMARYVTQLTHELCAALEAASLGAKRLDAWFFRVDNRIEAARIGMAAPTRDGARLAKLLCEKLERVDPGFGVEKIVLAAPGAEPLTYKQGQALGDGGAGVDLSGLIDTLSNRIGAEHVYRLASAQSDLPERSVKRVPALQAPDGFSWPMDWPRPDRFFARPESIETVALLPDAPPAAFTWRGARHRVRCADGPERVFGEWWKADEELARSRDYFQVEDEAGERFWIFRDGDGEDAETGTQRWYMVGVFG